MAKKAVIDIGTNTFNLLIAEVSQNTFDILHSEKEGVALGMGGINDDRISDDAFERGIACLLRFKSACDAHGIEVIKAFGTSALRGAKNREAFIQECFNTSGIKVEVISGDQEAQLIYEGVRWSYDFAEPSVVMDIGGGSTEFIFADKGGVSEKKSFDIGVSRIFQEFELNDPYSQIDTQKIERWLDDKSNNYFGASYKRAIESIRLVNWFHSRGTRCQLMDYPNSEKDGTNSRNKNQMGAQ